MFATEAPDQVLVSNYINGDESALAVLIQRHKQKVFSYVRMLVKDVQVAEDVFHIFSFLFFITGCRRLWPLPSRRQ